MVGQTIELDIFERSIDGFGQFIKEFYPEKDIPVVLQPGRLYLRQLGRQKKVIEYPFISMNINSISEIKDGYNNFALKKYGFVANKNSSNDFAYTYQMKNINVNMTVGFYTNTYTDIYSFTNNWITGEGILQFSLMQNDQAEIGITVLRNKDITYPQEQIEEVGEFFAVEVVCDMRTYTGKAIKSPLIKKYNLSTKTVTGN